MRWPAASQKKTRRTLLCNTPGCLSDSLHYLTHKKNFIILVWSVCYLFNVLRWNWPSAGHPPLARWERISPSHRHSPPPAENVVKKVSKCQSTRQIFFSCKRDPFSRMTYECERGCSANTHLLQPLSLRGHVQLQAVIRGHHLAHGEFDRLLLKHNGVAVGLLEARRLVILRGDCHAQDKRGHTQWANVYIQVVFFSWRNAFSFWCMYS